MLLQSQTTCIILAAGEGKRSTVEGISIYKGNLPLLDGSTPITRLLTACEKVQSIKSAYIITRERSYDFEGILDYNWSMPVIILDDCYGESYPLTSLKKGLSRISPPYTQYYIVSACDYIFDSRIENLLRHKVNSNEIIVAQSSSNIIACFKIERDALIKLCKDAEYKSNIRDLVAFFESSGGFTTYVDVEAIDVGSRENYLSYMIKSMIPENKWLRRLLSIP